MSEQEALKKAFEASRTHPEVEARFAALAKRLGKVYVPYSKRLKLGPTAASPTTQPSSSKP